MSVSALVRCTFYANAAPLGGNLSICGGTMSLESCLIVGATEGAGLEPDLDYGTVFLSCTDIWDNAGGDWVGMIADQQGQDGNISQDPWFCDPDALDLTLAVGSPCAPDGIPGCGLIGAWPVGCEWPVTAPDRSPASLVLAPNVPNPFNPLTTIRFETPTASRVRLSIHGLDGRLVARPVDGWLPAGDHDVRWRGRDRTGRLVSSGTYVYRLESGGAQVARRMTLVR